MTEQKLYTTEPTVRDALQKIGTDNVSVEFIDQAIQWASSDCDLYSGKSGWLVTDQFYYTIVGCCVQLAKCYAITLLNEKDTTQMNQFTLAIQRLEKIKETLINSGIISPSTDSGQAGIDYVPKITYPANANGEIIYAIRRKQITIEPYSAESLNPISSNGIDLVD